MFDTLLSDQLCLEQCQLFICGVQQQYRQLGIELVGAKAVGDEDFLMWRAAVRGPDFGEAE
ncbi:MAG: hypothetical protein QOG79_7032 [Mycobacterium sp.]|jgi:hypothetical protein|nr:hypothetical protein [Mycobacterium sp.]